MRNLHTLIVGQTGSGKSTLAKALLKLSARAIVFDRQWEYDSLPGARVVYSYAEAARYFMARRFDYFTLVLRPDNEADYFRMLELAMHAQRTEPHGPLVVGLEEASAYSDTHSMDGIVRDLYNKGRHLRISLLTVIQIDTDIHRVTRANSALIVTLKQSKLSGDMARYFGHDAIAQLVSLRDEYTPDPVQGRHFLAYPAGRDVYEEWYQETGYLAVPNLRDHAHQVNT